MVKPETTQDVIGSLLTAIAQTDANGRYRLEDVPPGAYYILAGRVDLPTFYPGASNIANGTMVEVTPGTAVSGIDFTLNRNSVRTEFTDVFRAALAPASVPVRVVAEGAQKLPFSSAAGAITLQFERVADGSITNVPLTNSSVTLQYVVAANTTDFKVSVANLPPAYAVRSITQSGAELAGALLKIPSNPVQPSVAAIPASEPLPPNGTALGLTSVVSSLLARGLQPTPIPEVVFTITSSGALDLRSDGVRVTGRGRPGDTHPVYLSGRQGMTFTDGSFEFTNVPRGVHTLGLVDSPGRTLGATLVVGDKDIENIQLEETPVLPSDIQAVREPEAAGERLPGSIAPPVTLRGRVLEEISKQPPASGLVFLNGRSGPSFPLNAEGRFEVPRLLPGSYTLELQIFGYSNLSQRVIVGLEDLSVELLPRKLY